MDQSRREGKKAMNFRTVAELNNDIRNWIHLLPKDLDLIVGIPRSGLLAGTLLALYMNLPLADVDGLCEGRLLSTGRRFDRIKLDFSRINKVLVLDDSVNSGEQMSEVRAKIEAAHLPYQIYYAAVYASPGGHCYVDYWYEIVDNPRCFEWNIMHHPILKESCIDIDGVLCRDPTAEENDDGQKYCEFLTSVDPFLIPTKPIGWIVTCRLEKYRPITEEWLHDHGIQYNHLIMMDLPDKETRIALGGHAEFKANVYKKSEAVLFIESSLIQAAEIARLAGKPVLCTENWQIINPGFVARSYTRGKKFAKEAIRNPFRAVSKFFKVIKRTVSVQKWKVLAKARKRHIGMQKRDGE